MNPPLHPSQEGNLQSVLQKKLPSWEGWGVGSWVQGANPFGMDSFDFILWVERFGSSRVWFRFLGGLQGCHLQFEKLTYTCLGQRDHAGQLRFGERGFLARTLDLDEFAGAGHDHIHVHLRSRIFRVTKIE